MEHIINPTHFWSSHEYLAHCQSALSQYMVKWVLPILLTIEFRMVDNFEQAVLSLSITYLLGVRSHIHT